MARVERRRSLLGAARSRPGITGVAYDTAWLASLPATPERRTSRFPTTLRWLADNQLADGSWGGSIRYEHDRILCTLAALAPLAEFGRRAEDRRAVEAGTRYLWQHGHLLRSEPVELVGFELLLPALVERARRAGVAVPPHLDVYTAERARKLELIPPQALYSPRATVVHSLEFLGDRADRERLRGAQGSNGAIGNSPAATAFFAERSPEPRALDYLAQSLSHAGGAMAPVLHPCETFELLWAAYHLHLGGVPTERLLSRAERQRLRRELQQGGVSLSPTFPIPDADDSAVALLLLHELGEVVDVRVLQAFGAADGSFVSFPYERHSSVGVNVHVLHALARVPGYPEAATAIARVVDYLGQQHNGLFWFDKWHISPLYATAHALCVVDLLPPEQARPLEAAVARSREWLRQSQNADGSWGFYGQPTAEETAYGLLALAGSTEPADGQRCAAAARFLGETADQVPPPLWVDKCLYTPPLVVKAVLDGALAKWNLHSNRS